MERAPGSPRRWRASPCSDGCPLYRALLSHEVAERVPAGCHKLSELGCGRHVSHRGPAHPCCALQLKTPPASPNARLVCASQTLIRRWVWRAGRQTHGSALRSRRPSARLAAPDPQASSSCPRAARHSVSGVITAGKYGTSTSTRHPKQAPGRRKGALAAADPRAPARARAPARRPSSAPAPLAPPLPAPPCRTPPAPGVWCRFVRVVGLRSQQSAVTGRRQLALRPPLSVQPTSIRLHRPPCAGRHPPARRTLTKLCSLSTRLIFQIRVCSARALMLLTRMRLWASTAGSAAPLQSSVARSSLHCRAMVGAAGRSLRTG